MCLQMKSQINIAFVKFPLQQKAKNLKVKLYYQKVMHFTFQLSIDNSSTELEMTLEFRKNELEINISIKKDIRDVFLKNGIPIYRCRVMV